MLFSFITDIVHNYKKV